MYPDSYKPDQRREDGKEYGKSCCKQGEARQPQFCYVSCKPIQANKLLEYFSLLYLYQVYNREQ